MFSHLRSCGGMASPATPPPSLFSLVDAPLLRVQPRSRCACFVCHAWSFWTGELFFVFAVARRFLRLFLRCSARASAQLLEAAVPAPLFASPSRCRRTRRITTVAVRTGAAYALRCRPSLAHPACSWSGCCSRIDPHGRRAAARPVRPSASRQLHAPEVSRRAPRRCGHRFERGRSVILPACTPPVLLSDATRLSQLGTRAACDRGGAASRRRRGGCRCRRDAACCRRRLRTPTPPPEPAFSLNSAIAAPQRRRPLRYRRCRKPATTRGSRRLPLSPQPPPTRPLARALRSQRRATAICRRCRHPGSTASPRTAAAIPRRPRAVAPPPAALHEAKVAALATRYP